MHVYYTWNSFSHTHLKAVLRNMGKCYWTKMVCVMINRTICSSNDPWLSLYEMKRGTVWKREWFVYVRHFGNCVVWQIHLLLVCKNRLISGYFLWNNLIELSIVRNLWLLKIDEDFIYFYFELVVKRTCISSKLKLNISIHRSS